MKFNCPCCGELITAPAQHSPNQIQCPLCGEWDIMTLPSMNKKICCSCDTTFDWSLKPQQKSVLIDGLIGEEK